MIFVLCNNKQYEKLYQKEAYKHIRLEEHTDLAGYAGINVYIHEDWYTDTHDDRVEYLEQQLIALADFKYIKLNYVDEDGHTDKHFPPEMASPESPQRTLEFTQGGSTTSTENSSLSLTEEERMALLDTEDGCGGACSI